MSSTDHCTQTSLAGMLTAREIGKCSFTLSLEEEEMDLGSLQSCTYTRAHVCVYVMYYMCVYLYLYMGI